MIERLTARVRVPASSANLGAGFDCVGIAVDRWLSATVRASVETGTGAPEIMVNRGGTLAGLAIPSASDTLAAGFIAMCKAHNRALPRSLDFDVTSDIPVSRGLGSSSAALVAGAMLAGAALDLASSKQGVAALCSDLEGHPDNVAPAVFGGAVLGIRREHGESHWTFAPVGVHVGLSFVFAVPDVLVETQAARDILPRDIRHLHAVRAAAKAAALIKGLVTGDASLLHAALDDVLHVPYRRHLVPGYDDVVAAATAAGAFGATLSGSGSTILAIAPHEHAERVAAIMQRTFTDRGVAAVSFVQAGILDRAAEVIAD